MRRILSVALVASGCGAGASPGVELRAFLHRELPPSEAEGRGTRGVELFELRRPGKGKSIAAEAPVPRVDALGGGVEHRLVIYNGTLVVQVAEVDDTLKRAREIVKRAGGWMQSMKKGEAVFRVPARAFEQVMDSLAALGVVVDRAVSGSDVTDEYRDLDLRLRNAEALRVKIVDLLKRAEKVEEALKVEKELARLTEEIERLKGRLRVLTDRMAYSTVTLELVKRPRGRTSRAAWTPFDWVRRLGAHGLFRYW